MTGAGRRETAGSPRLVGLDVARGVALLGMFVAHTVLVGGEKIVDGRSAILFATVAGVSLGLLTGGAAPPGPGARGRARITIVVRGAVLVLLGIGLTFFLRPPIAVILDYYGFGFLVLLGLLFAARPVLAGVAVVAAVAGPPLVALVSDAAKFDELAAPVQLFARWLIYGEYPMLVWSAYLLVGLILARSDLRRRVTAVVALASGALGAILGYGAAALLPGVTAAAHTDTTAEVLGSGGVAVAVIGALALLDSATGFGERVARILRFLLAPVAAAGAMPLTLYTAQAIVLAIVHAVVEEHGRWVVPGWLLPALVVGSLVVATLWRRFVGTGPLEAGLRVLTRLVIGAPPRPRVAP